jgi:hypothetical protein
MYLTFFYKITTDDHIPWVNSRWIPDPANTDQFAGYNSNTLISNRLVSPEFMSVAGMHIIEGRDFVQTDIVEMGGSDCKSGEQPAR